MTLKEIVALYNPDNARRLTVEQVQAMQSLDDDQIKALAEAYPNNPRGNNYLILVDTSVEMTKQLFPLSTWKNLHNVRTKSGLKNLKAYTFRELFNAPKRKAQDPRVAPKVAEPIDLSESVKLEGIKPPVQEPVQEEAVSAKPVKEKKERKQRQPKEQKTDEQNS